MSTPCVPAPTSSGPPYCSIQELSTEHFYLEFLMDDSGSMRMQDSNLTNGQKCSRWEEAKERLLILLEMLACA